MTIDIEIRDALPTDAAAACEVLRRSITELCVADHRNDPDILRRWLANKTPEIVTSWIANSGNSMLVAIGEGGILSVGAVTDAGEITLNYVSPDARFAGGSAGPPRSMVGGRGARRSRQERPNRDGQCCLGQRAILGSRRLRAGCEGRAYARHQGKLWTRLALNRNTPISASEWRCFVCR